MKNFLGIDWGKKKIGVALAHAETRVAVTYGTWPVDQNLWSILREIVALEGIGTIVLGDPEHPDAQNQEDLQKFKNKLEHDLGVTVMLQNEMFTSKMAQENLKEGARRAVDANDDAEAARIILADWLGRSA